MATTDITSRLDDPNIGLKNQQDTSEGGPGVTRCQQSSLTDWSIPWRSTIWPMARGYDQETFFRQLAKRRGLGRMVAREVLIVVAGAGTYGATLGLWRSGWLAAYVAIKLPALLLLTALLVMTLNWMAALLMGSGLQLLQVTALTYRVMAIACVLLASLAPVSAFLAWTAPEPTPHDVTAHNLLLLVHVLFIGWAGLCGNIAMWQALGRLSRKGTPVRALFAIWLATGAFVGGQLAWILRPFVGSPHYPVALFREDALEGNFFEFLTLHVVWPLLGTGG